MGDEIYAVALDGLATQLTQENKLIYDQLEMGKVEGRWMKTTDVYKRQQKDHSDNPTEQYTYYINRKLYPT